MTKQTQTKRAGEARQPVESTQIEEHTCSECGRATITDETGALVCVACGLEWEVETATAHQKTPDIEQGATLGALLAKHQPQAEHSPLPSKWHDCDIAEKQIKQLQHERDDARNNAEALAEACRAALILLNAQGPRQNKVIANCGELSGDVSKRLREALARWESEAGK